MTVLDLSNHDRDTFDALCLKAAGVTRVILGVWDLEWSRLALRGLRNAGIIVEDLYAFVYFGLAIEDHDVVNAQRLAKEEGGILTIWLDCESNFTESTLDFDTEAQGLTVGYRIAQVATYRARIMQAGWHVGIYTGYFWWREKMGNTTIFADGGDPLWFANYPEDGQPIDDLAKAGWAFGGWNIAAVHQYTSSFNVCGRDRDANYWFMEDPMTPEEKAAFKALQADVTRLNAIVAGNGTFPVIATANNMAALAKALDAPSLKPGTLYTLTGEQTLKYLHAQGNNVYLGLANLQRDFGLLAAEVDDLQAMGEPVETSLLVGQLAEKYEALAAGISALDDVLESLRTGDGDTDPTKVP